MVIEVITHALDHQTRYLRAAWAIEVGHRKTVVDAFESGELFSDFVDG
jgi:hypothetical protein